MSGDWERQDDRLKGYALMGVGAIIATLCGACTWDSLHGTDPYGRVFGYFGLVPIGLGIWIFVAGLGLVRNNRKR